MSIEYDLTSFAPHFSKEEMDSLKRKISIDFQKFDFDPEYTVHISRYNGGRPVTKYFKTKDGNSVPIDYFLNFSDRKQSERKFKELNVNVMWSAIDDRLSLYQFPFAITRGGDFLCFDYEGCFPPRVVLWYQEWSKEGQPKTEGVARNFRDFIDSLTASP